jgi:hypothetical protein
VKRRDGGRGGSAGGIISGLCFDFNFNFFNYLSTFFEGSVLYERF